jgi:hypothetical protein
MAFDCNLLMKEPKPMVNASETSRTTAENLVIMTLGLNIENIDDKNKVTIVNFEFDYLVISAEGNWFDREGEELFSEDNIILKKMTRN